MALYIHFAFRSSRWNYKAPLRSSCCCVTYVASKFNMPRLGVASRKNLANYLASSFVSFLRIWKKFSFYRSSRRHKIKHRDGDDETISHAMFHRYMLVVVKFRCLTWQLWKLSFCLLFVVARFSTAYIEY